MIENYYWTVNTNDRKINKSILKITYPLLYNVFYWFVKKTKIFYSEILKTVKYSVKAVYEEFYVKASSARKKCTCSRCPVHPASLPHPNYPDSARYRAGVSTFTLLSKNWPKLVNSQKNAENRRKTNKTFPDE